MNKSFKKRIKMTRTGKLLVRKPGGNHFNGKEKRSKQLARKRAQSLTMSQKDKSLFLLGKN